ncbi:MAG TPA: HAD-IA family hydrolase [Crinalium sp.]
MTVIIFDFDGTIADTFDAVLRIINRLGNEFGLKPLGAEDVKRYQNLSSREVIRQSEISVVRLPFLLRRLKAELNHEIHQLKLIPGMRDALITLKQQGHQLGIVTSNSSENVAIFLKAHQLNDLFDFIYSGTTIFGKSRVIRRILHQRRLNPASVVYVGDETRDIEAARNINVKVVAVSWGFNSSKALIEQNPDYLIHQPDELIDIINKFQNVVNQ